MKQPFLWKILVGDDWQPMTWAELRDKVPAEISDLTLKRRLTRSQALCKLVVPLNSGVSSWTKPGIAASNRERA